MNWLGFGIKRSKVGSRHDQLCCQYHFGGIFLLYLGYALIDFLQNWDRDELISFFNWGQKDKGKGPSMTKCVKTSHRPSGWKHMELDAARCHSVEF